MHAYFPNLVIYGFYVNCLDKYFFIEKIKDFKIFWTICRKININFQQKKKENLIPHNFSIHLLYTEKD